MKVILIQSSLNPQSHTALLVEEAEKILTQKNAKHETIDLRELEMQFCDGREMKEYNHDMQTAYKTLESGDAFIFASPVYQYSISGVLKNFLDIVMHAMKGKTCGIMINSGGVRSYLASAELMKLLSFEISMISVQPTIHTWGEDFANGKLTNQEIPGRIEHMIEELLSLKKTK